MLSGTVSIDHQRLEELVTAIGRAVLPGGDVVPVYTRTSAVRVLRYLEEEGPAPFAGFRAFLGLVDAATRLRHGQGVRRAAPAQIRGALRALEGFGYGTRMAVKYGLAPIKVLHLDQPGFFDAIGCSHRPRPAPPERDRVRERQVFDAASLSDIPRLEADVVVVGSGAGGAVAAFELARRGHQVVMLEAGPYADRSDFTRLSRVELSRKLYRPIAETTALGNAMIPIVVGRSVGGTTTINSGTCFRAPDEVLEAWSRDLQLPELGPEAMRPHFDRVEEILGVAPSEDRYLGGCARVVARGAERLGLAHGPLARNAPGCDGQGVCCFGCPTDAKRSTNVSYVPRALRAGAVLVPNTRVEQVLVRGGTAYGVRARVRDPATGETSALTVMASRVVIACGTLYTPPLLMSSRLGGASGHLGRHLSVHPASGCYALFDERIDQSRAVPQGYSIEEFRREGILLEGASTPAEMMAMDLKAMGPELVAILERYNHVAAFGFMIKDGSRGRVLPGPGGGPRVLYHLGRDEVRRVRRAMNVLVDVFRAAGARAIFPPVHGHGALRSAADIAAFRDAALGPRDFELTAFHPLGTARLARRAADGVLDPAHEVYGTRRLHVIDGSAVPGSLGVNPQITIMAMATRAAACIDELLGSDLGVAA